MLVAPSAVAETPEFLRFAERFLSDDQHDAVIDYLATYPTAGVLTGIPQMAPPIADNDSRSESGPELS